VVAGAAGARVPAAVSAPAVAVVLVAAAPQEAGDALSLDTTSKAPVGR